LPSPDGENNDGQRREDFGEIHGGRLCLDWLIPCFFQKDRRLNLSPASFDGMRMTPNLYLELSCSTD
jgi:hypothetical protein